jgi:1,4-dihydroxy-2-naphthoate octaprenyltransferase
VWWLLAVGAVAVLAAWTYTGGRRPYGYVGLGEVGVFVFFGLFAVLGTTITQAGQVSAPAWLGAAAIGLLACALIMANNLRDLPTDALAGKRTLAVRLGETRARGVYGVCVVAPVLLGAACALWAPWSLLVVLCLGPAVLLAPMVLMVRGRLGGDLTVQVGPLTVSSPPDAQRRARALVRVLTLTGQLELVFAVLLGLGLAV